jgi:DNA-binding NarL/FixJ family response regulator
VKLRIFIADDHPLVREGVRTVLSTEQDMELVGEADDGEAALLAIGDLRPDVAVLDIDMPRLTGIEVTRRLAETTKKTPVVILSMHLDQSLVLAAVEAGARGYVAKQDAARDLLRAIRSAVAGDLFVSPRVTSGLVDSLRKPLAERTVLSPRERDIVRLVSQGLSSKEIAAELGLTSKTVEGYRSAIMDKLNIHSVAGLVKYALRERLIVLQD